MHDFAMRFKQKAAEDPGMPWAIIDPKLWSLAFLGRTKVSQCKHCFSLTHASADHMYKYDTAQKLNFRKGILYSTKLLRDKPFAVFVVFP